MKSHRLAAGPNLLLICRKKVRFNSLTFSSRMDDMLKESGQVSTSQEKHQGKSIPLFYSQ